jgi:hypothetical protein
VADHPLRPATHRSLGRPLPYQQANGTRAHPQTVAFKKRPPLIHKSEDLWMSFGISIAFAMLSPIQGQITHVLLTRAPLYSPLQAEAFSYDLHVLSTPPAFTLSQDQTLQLNLCLAAGAANNQGSQLKASSLFSFQRSNLCGCPLKRIFIIFFATFCQALFKSFFFQLRSASVAV